MEGTSNISDESRPFRRTKESNNILEKNSIKRRWLFRDPIQRGDSLIKMHWPGNEVHVCTSKKHRGFFEVPIGFYDKRSTITEAKSRPSFHHLRPPTAVPRCFYYFQNDVYNSIPVGQSCNSFHGGLNTTNRAFSGLFALTKLSSFRKIFIHTWPLVGAFDEVMKRGSVTFCPIK